MLPFPSPVECSVASALLLLSNTTPLAPPHSSKLGTVEGEKKSVKERNERKSNSGEEILSSVSSGSKFCVSSLTHKIRIVAVVPRCYEMKFKVARRKRSEVRWCSGHQNSVLQAPPEDAAAVESTESAGSCLSSTSSAASSARSHYMKRNGLMMKPARDDQKEPKRIESLFVSPYLRGRADAILKLLSSGCFSEVSIRQVLGDSPSTSKALRILLRQEKVKRYGNGGRRDPFIYTIA